MDIIAARGKLGTKLATAVDAEGHCIKFDVREDEAQSEKLEETIELLVAAGYFRARIKTMTAFDKIVGGMTWCISFCDFDLDVDLLYHDSLALGQKIALTEKIVMVLVQMKCPYALEPHQIQGLDMLRIFPAVQWLVKKAVERKEEIGNLMKAYAVSQFDLNHSSLQIDNDGNVMDRKLSEVDRKLRVNFDPCRVYRRLNTDVELTESVQVQSTLLEYGHLGAVSSSKDSAGKDEAEENSLKDTEVEDTMQLLKAMAHVQSADEAKFSDDKLTSLIDSDHLQRAASAYAQKESERRTAMKGQSAVVYQEQLLDKLTTNLTIANKRLQSLQVQLTDKEEKHSKCKAEYDQSKEHHNLLIVELGRLVALEKAANERQEEHGKLLSDYETCKLEETQFKKRCKDELVQLKSQIDSLRNSGPLDSYTVIKDLTVELENYASMLQKARLELSTKNREISKLQRQIDEVPSRAELNLYQRRFLELYNQMTTKLKETKQCFAMYNTLQDVIQLMRKEVDLLDSISESFQHTVTSEATRAEFLGQLQQIVEGLKQNKLRAERSNAEEKSKLERLRDSYHDIVERQRLYFKAVKDLQEECRRSELLYSKMKELGEA